MTFEQFGVLYLARRRADEIDLLNKIAPHLSIARQRKVIFITLVTKQDLWWHSRYQVKDYYEGGNYDIQIKQIESQLGRNNFIHEYFSASLVTENFRFADGAILAPVAEGYEQKIQVINLERVLGFIEQTFDVEMGR